MLGEFETYADGLPAWERVRRAIRSADMAYLDSIRPIDWQPWRHDLERGLAALDFRRQPHPSDAEFLFSKGHRGGALLGMCTRSVDSSAGCLLLARPHKPVRRIAALAGELTKKKLRISQLDLLPGRTRVALSVLVSHPLISRDDFFRRVYGFKFETALHGGLLRVLMHRCRKWIGDLGEIRFVDSDIHTTVRSPFCVEDPTFESALDLRLLRVLSSPTPHSAKKLAEKLKVPLRSAQTALRALSDAGVVERRSSGRRVEYRVEDTTFSEPTIWRS